MSGSSCVRANQRGRPVRTPRAEGGAGTSRARPWVGRLWIWPWVGCWSRAAPIRPRQARPSRVAEGVGDAGFHIGAVPPGRYAVRRRAKYPRRPRHGTSKRARHRARHRARPRQARPSRVAEGVGDAGFHVRSEIPHPQTSGGRAATLRSTRFDRRGDDAFQITILAMNKILLRTEISRRAPHVRGGVAVHFPVRRVVPDGGAPVCTDALNCVPPVATI